MCINCLDCRPNLCLRNQCTVIVIEIILCKMFMFTSTFRPTRSVCIIDHQLGVILVRQFKPWSVKLFVDRCVH